MKILFPAIIFTLCNICAFGQIEEKSAVDNIFAEWNKPDVPGCAIGIIKNGEMIYANGYGTGDLEHDIALGPSSVFYLGSVSKQFVTFSILLLEEEGKLNLDDKIQKFLPDFPVYESPLTIRHFIHHTSGVRDYLTLMYLMGRNYLDHIEDDEVYELIKRQRSLNFSPGEQYLYSNSCYFMLAMIVEKAAGQSLKEFAGENIFKQLGMNNTMFYDDNTDIIKNRVFSYAKVPDEDKFDNLIMRFDLVGSGGVYSCIKDLFLWDQNFYSNKLGKGGQEIIQKMHEEGLLNNGETSGYAFALDIGTYKGLKTVSHGGSLAGYRAQLLRFPDQQFSVVILANRSDANPSEIAFQIAEIFLQDDYIKEDKVEEIKPEVSKNAREDIETDLDISNTILEEYAGNYFSKEMNTTYKLFVENEVLEVKIGNYDPMTLDAYDKDQFTVDGEGLLFQFRRDVDSIIGFELDAGRVKNLKFSKE
ncbi:MAG: serine hydrolase [Calditrichae bacterium]|nr:serine hydrolase [Calditrichia bacterium]